MGKCSSLVSISFVLDNVASSPETSSFYSAASIATSDDTDEDEEEEHDFSVEVRGGVTPPSRGQKPIGLY